MTRLAVIDPTLSVRILSTRTLRYDTPSDPREDRPAHVRAASGIAIQHGRLVIAQDDTLFFGVVSRDGVSAMRLPRGLEGRRRFEVALGNKLDKVDLESCVAVDDELWAFGSGSLPMRDKICRVSEGVVRMLDCAPLYARCREALDDCLNIEGAAAVRDELWLFHRGNTGEHDPGPAVIRFSLAAFRGYLDASPMPPILGVEEYALGTIDGVRLGFTDAVAIGDRVLYLAAAEAAANAIDDGRAVGSHLGVIEPDGRVRCTPISLDGKPIKAEGLAIDPRTPDRGWVVIDPDDTEQPATLIDIELVGFWP
ncbi:MAG TPA: hypothetical protein VGM39_07090 [Kofleriaceae bacterium]